MLGALAFDLQAVFETPPVSRIFVVEDDPLFARLLQRAAARHGVRVDVFHPDHDFDRLPLDGDYDAAIIDCELGHISGPQIAALYGETPVLLVSRDAGLARASGPWPRSVRAFRCKRDGVAALVAAGIQLGGEALLERNH